MSFSLWIYGICHLKCDIIAKPATGDATKVKTPVFQEASVAEVLGALATPSNSESDFGEL